jgi:hypothetical protein
MVVPGQGATGGCAVAGILFWNKLDECFRRACCFFVDCWRALEFAKKTPGSRAFSTVFSPHRRLLSFLRTTTAIVVKQAKPKN